MMPGRTLGGTLAAGAFRVRRQAVAIETGGRAIRYADIDAAAHAVTADLERLGIAPGSNIGILTDDTSLIVPAMLAIMARGCVFAMLDPGLPPGILRRNVEATDLRCLLVEPALMDGAQEALGIAGPNLIKFDAGIYADPDTGGSVIARLDAAVERPLYLYFTSGTAGSPKPILGRADSLLQFVTWEIETFELDETVRVAQLTPPSHDPFLRDILVPLVTGGTICVPETRRIVLSPVELGRWLDTSSTNLVHCTPTVFKNLCAGPLASKRFPRLRHVLIAGEQLRGAHLERWYHVFGDRIALVNLYGPTETTLAKLFHRIAPADAGRSVIPIGRPIAGAEVRIMATATAEAAQGEVGELVIETAFGTLGYYRRPDLNASVFDREPSSEPGSPVRYRTGDLVRQLPDAAIEFVGRRDRQSKIYGNRIDLGEVEDALLARTVVGGVAAAVLPSDGGAGPDRLVAFYLSEHALDEPEIKRLLARDLPALMIPDAWVRVEALPTNASAKIDVDGLAALFAARSSAADNAPGRADRKAPDLADRLLAIWRELLRDNDLGLDNAFMDSGGESLSIMLLIARLDEEFGYELSLWHVFEDLTVRKLCILMQEESEDRQEH